MATFLTIESDGPSAGTAALNLIPSGTTLAVGDLCVLFVKWEVSANDPATPTATNGVFPTWNTLTSKQAHTNGDLWIRSYYSICEVATATTVSINMDDASNFTRAHAIFFRPDSGPGFVFTPQTVQGANNGSDNDLTTVSSITPDARGVGVAFFGEYAGVTYTNGSGWTEPTGGDDGAYTEYRLEPSAGAPFIGEATASGSMQYLAHMAFFADDTPPTPPAGPTLHVIRSGIRLR